MSKPHQFRDYSNDQLEELFSNYLLDSWSYSKVNAFSRNEKAFEMNYIYRQPFKMGASAIAGSAYHYALENFFVELKHSGINIDIVDMQELAFRYIDGVYPNQWKIQKTTPTIEACQQKATKICTALLTNFFTDIQVYMKDLKEIISIELKCNEFLTINGVDIPLPCHARIDLVIKTIDDKIVIIDHKSKASFSDEKELKFTMGKQGITYANIYETESGTKVDEVWIIENKYSKNKDGSPQLNCFKVEMNKDNIKLYESILYEPLKRMLEAISDPDYTYLINDADNYVDRAEIYEFWAQTMIAEIDDFNLPDNKKELIKKRLKKIRDASIASIDPKIIKKFRENASEFIQYDLTNKNMTREDKIEHTLRTLGIVVNVAHTFKGFSSDTFLIDVSVGQNISSVQRFKLDIASALNVPSIRMAKDLFVYKGRAYLSIEAVKQRETFLYFDAKHTDGSKIPIGFDNFNNKVFWDLDNPTTPHLLMCGSTGSGKSVCIKSTIEYARLSGINDIIIFDPKFEFLNYKSLGVSVYSDIEKIESKMEQLVRDMNDRIKVGISSKTMVIFDEFADAVSNSKSGSDLNVYQDVVVGMLKNGQPKTKREITNVKKSLEENLRILLQKGRSTGYRVLAATQRASVKVITGDAKVNFPVQICFKVPKEIDSKVVLDESGAESLIGKGDGLLKSPEYDGVVRFQAFIKEN